MMDQGTRRLYKILFGLQIVSLGIVTGCALYIAYFG
jgi:hypothetical protein